MSFDVEASEVEEVSMPSRAYTSFLLSTTVGDDGLLKLMCQCPLGLIPHFYLSVHGKSIEVERKCQCPLGLIPHFYVSSPLKELENSSIMCQCPLGLIPHFYEEEEWTAERFTQKCQCPLGLIPHFYRCESRTVAVREYVSMPSRAYTSFLQYPFRNLGFMRFPEPVFAGIYQNILTAAVFRAC